MQTMACMHWIIFYLHALQYILFNANFILNYVFIFKMILIWFWHALLCLCQSKNLLLFVSVVLEKVAHTYSVSALLQKSEERGCEERHTPDHLMKSRCAQRNVHTLHMCKTTAKIEISPPLKNATNCIIPAFEM